MKKFPTALQRRIDEVNEFISRANRLDLLPGGFCESTHYCYVDLEPIVVKNQFVYFTNKRDSPYNFITPKRERLNVNNEEDLDGIKYYLKVIRRTLKSNLD